MKKWLSILTAVTACVLCVSVFVISAHAASVYNYHGVTEDQAIQDAEYRVSELAQAVQSGDSTTFASDNPEVNFEKAQSDWNTMLKKLGDVTGFAQDKKGFSAQINDSDMTVTVSVVGSTGRTGSVTVIYGQYGPKQIQASLNDTFGEGMAKAGMNTLLGMGMAFFVLIIIALVIKFAFPPINRLSKKLDEQNAQASARRPAPAAAPAAVETASSAQQDETGDGALVAVIAAAVAAAEGRKDTSGFVVRSIRKSR